MTLEELRTELETILALEEQPSVDWQVVKARCVGTVGRLTREAEPLYPHDVVYHFLDDPDVRQKDHAYGRMQRDRLKEWLFASD